MKKEMPFNCLCYLPGDAGLHMYKFSTREWEAEDEFPDEHHSKACVRVNATCPRCGKKVGKTWTLAEIFDTMMVE